MNISRQGIVETILNAQEWFIVKEYFAGDYDRFSETCGITKYDLVDYVKNHGFPKGWVFFTKQTYDGLYILRQAETWVVYLQERNNIEEKSWMEFNSFEQARDYVLETYYLPKQRKNI